MVINLRSASGIAAIWLAAVVGVSATAWVAIDRAGRDITNVNIKTMAPAPIIPPTIAPRPTSTPPMPSATARRSVAPPPATRPSSLTTPAPAPTPAPTPTPTPPRTASARHGRTPGPTPQDRAIRVTGGLVSVRCTGTAIRLRIAQPEFEWRVHVDSPRSGLIVVTFGMGDEESQLRTQVTAVCTKGAPVFHAVSGTY
jgi:hypothetical protein